MADARLGLMLVDDHPLLRGKELHLAEATIKNYVQSLTGKLGASDRGHAAVMGIQMSIVEQGPVKARVGSRRPTALAASCRRPRASPSNTGEPRCSRAPPLSVEEVRCKSCPTRPGAS